MECIKVSVVCNTYNQVGYIGDAIESFLMQKTNFPFEILIHDDASTDGTADVIKKYEEKYPDKIKPIYQKENQHSKKVKITLSIQIPRAKGKYIAFCEGDDYWTDPYKLQKQYDALESHPDIDICAHSAFKVNAETKQIIGCICPSKSDVVFSIEEVIKGGGTFVATNSLMYKKELINDEYEFAKLWGLDYIVQIHGSLNGGMLYLKDNMSCYRILSKGSWNERVFLNKKFYIEHINTMKNVLNVFDKETNYKYSELLKVQICIRKFNILENISQLKQLKKEYGINYKAIPLKIRIKKVLLLRFPFLQKIKNRRRGNGTK